MRPEITVLMPVYNGEKYLKEAIDSVLGQTFSEFELLIVNDGSTDSSEAIIRSYADPRIRLISQPNGGVSKALNTGLKDALGTYIARFDADDVCYPQRLSEQYAFMTANPGYVIAGSDADYMDMEGDYIFTFSTPGHSDAEIKEKLLLGCPFIHSSVIYKKESVMKLGGYEVKAHGFEDYFLWMKLVKTGLVFNAAKPLLKVRFNPESVTVDNRDYSPEFRQLHKKALLTGVITDEEELQILKSIQKLSKSKKEISYHRMLGKKYLWNNYAPSKARRHLLKAIRLAPLARMSYLLLLLSFLPKPAIAALYNKLK